MTQSDLDALVEAVRASAKYRSVSVDLIRHVGERELASRSGLKEAIKATKNKLHQVAGAYLDHAPRYSQWLEELRAAHDPGELRRVCARLMGQHTSTQERLPILDEFYQTVLAGIPAPRRVADLACGLNPLAVPWMGLPPDVEYHAADVYDDMMAFTQAFFEIAGVKGKAESRDVVGSPPAGHFDLALLLKALPCLEQLDKQVGRRLLEAVDADYLIVSFPVHSLGGRAKGMLAHYEDHFRRLIAGRPWRCHRFIFQTELAFMVVKNQI